MSDENKSKDESNLELDELLENAIKDFDIYNGSTNAASTSVPKDVKESKESPEEVVDDAWAHDFLKSNAENLEKDFQKLLQSECGVDLQNVLQSVINAGSSDSSGPGNEEKDYDVEATIANALKGLSVNSEILKNSEEASYEDNLTGDFLPMVQTMMQSLLSKEVLYPSLKELVVKYPSWLDEKKDSLPTEDYERYAKQLSIMQKVCTELEKEKENDSQDVKKRQFEKILSLMQEMQNCGQPPEDLIGDQTGSFQVDGEGAPLPGFDPQSCSIM